MHSNFIEAILDNKEIGIIKIIIQKFMDRHRQHGQNFDQLLIVMFDFQWLEM